MPGAEEALRVERVWRRYRRWFPSRPRSIKKGASPASSTSTPPNRPNVLKEMLVRLLARRRLRHEDFWALRDVSFVARRGEMIGFCGANGAGKTTLLKVVGRILPPTHGRVIARGRIATLLELGTGFHPELSGRENLRLNGAIAGLSRGEIEAKSGSIIEFSELGDAIDNPVKEYSAGMYLRLGFSIATHLDADILLIDEALSAGDVSFQSKSAEWLERLRRDGVTVLMVSHALTTLAGVCDRVVWLDHGQVRADDIPRAALGQYCPELFPPTEPPAGGSHA